MFQWHRTPQNFCLTMSSKLVELERQHRKLEQYTRRECLDFSGIPNSVAPKDLENFILGLCRKLVLILTNRILLLVIGWERQTERLSSSWIRRMLKMFIQIRRNWKMLFLVCFPTICKAETIWPQEVKMIGGREVCPEKEKFLYHRVSARTTDICMVYSKRRRRRVWFLISGSSTEPSVWGSCRIHV